MRYFARFGGRALTEEDVEGYHRFFPRRHGTIAGEWSPDYLTEDDAFEKLRRCGATRLLVLVRDPVDRIWSHMHADTYWITSGLMRPHPPVKVMRAGLFHAGLTRALEVFERADILVLQYEQCVLDTAGQLRRTHEFLGLEPDFVPASAGRWWGRPIEQRPPPTPVDVRDAMTGFYRHDVERLVQDWPEIDLSLWPNFAERS